MHPPTDIVRGVLSRDFVELMARLLERNPSRRATLPELRRHSWLREAIPGSTDEDKLLWLDQCENVYVEYRVNDQEVASAVTPFKKLTKHISRGAKKMASQVFGLRECK